MSHGHLPEIRFDTSLYYTRTGKQPRGYRSLWSFSWENSDGGHTVTEWHGWYSDVKAHAYAVARNCKKTFPWVRTVNVLP